MTDGDEQKLRYTNIAARLLPERFEFRRLVGIYEAILARNINPSNLRTTLLRLNLIERAGRAKSASRVGRPAHLYRFRRREIERRDRGFL